MVKSISWYDYDGNEHWKQRNMKWKYKRQRYGWMLLENWSMMLGFEVGIN